jgi:putative phosphoribosyl transferase
MGTEATMGLPGRIASRTEAGRKLGERLLSYAGKNNVIVLALPRGGVPIGREIANTLGAPLDVFFVRKIGVPGYPELAMGAIASGGPPLIDPHLAKEFGLSVSEVDEAIAQAQRELARQESSYRKGRPPIDLRGKMAILVDDGIATGHTMRTAAQAAKQMGATRIVIATGAAPLSTFLQLQTEVDEVVCVITAEDFRAVGNFYEDFSQVSDEEVKRLLAKEK